MNLNIQGIRLMFKPVLMINERIIPTPVQQKQTASLKTSLYVTVPLILLLGCF